MACIAWWKTYSTLTRKSMTSLSVKFILAAIPACTSMQKSSTLNKQIRTDCETK